MNDEVDILYMYYTCKVTCIFQKENRVNIISQHIITPSMCNSPVHSLDLLNLHQETVENKVREYLNSLENPPISDIFPCITNDSNEKTYATLEPVDFSCKMYMV